jgi:hypothetical protein
MSAVNLSPPDEHGEHVDLDMVDLGHGRLTWSLTSGLPEFADVCCVCDEPITDDVYYGAHNCQDYAHARCVNIVRR